MSTTKFLSLRTLFIFTILGLFSVLLQAQETGVIIKEKISISPKVSTPNIINNKTITIPDDLRRSYPLGYAAEVDNLSNLAYDWGDPTVDPISGNTIWPRIWPVMCNGVVVRVNFTKDPVGHLVSGEGTFGIFPAGTPLTFDWFPELFTTPPFDANMQYVQPECYICEYPPLIYSDSCGGYFTLYGKYIYEGNVSYNQIPIEISVDRVDFCPPVSIFKDSITSSDILYGESQEITIGLVDACGRHTSDIAPTPVNYHVAITSGNEFGYLYNQATEECGDSISVSAEDCYANFMFSATEQQPTEDQQVELRVWSDDASYTPCTTSVTVQSTSCMNLSVSKLQILPGETVSININSSYPPDQIYSIQMNTGEGYGKLRCVETGEEGTSISGIQPFEFIAADSIAGNSVVIEIQASVLTGGGPVAASIGMGKDSLLNGTGSMQINSLTETVKASIQSVMGKQQKKRQSSLINMNQMAMAASVEEGCEAIVNVTIKDECKMEIVTCGDNKPQTLNDVFKDIEIVTSTTPWQWIDPTNGPQTATANDGCSQGEAPAVGTFDIGKTFLIEKIGNYKLFDDLIVNVCLDKSDPQNPIWQFNIDNLRIPVFADVCPPPTLNGIQSVDLGDENSWTTWMVEIGNDCNNWNLAAKDIKYNIIGWYRHNPKIGAPRDASKSYYFSGGVRVHENVHITQRKEALQKKRDDIDKVIKGIRGLAVPKDENHKCPEKARDERIKNIKNSLNDILTIVTNIKHPNEPNYINKEYDALQIEVDADAGAKKKYEDIRDALKSFQKLHSPTCKIKWD